MAFKSLTHFISVLESSGELYRIREFVSPHLEITEIADRMVKNRGKALLFENTGTGFPLLINAFASEKRMCIALGVKSLDDVGNNISDLMQHLLGPKKSFMDKVRTLPALSEIASFMPKRTTRRGSCQAVIDHHPDLGKLPVLTCWPADGGPFITLPGVHTKDIETGARNVGMYRMQVFDAVTTGMHWHLHKGSTQHFRKYRDRGLKMPVTVTLGGDPVYTYVATAPLQENMDEYMLAGFLRKKKVEMVKCLTNDLEVPEDVDFVIEGYIDPNEEMVLEGPFGDHTGFYSLPDKYPKFHVTCITHRKDAVYPATIVGIPPMEDEWFGKATERIFLFPLKTTIVPELVDMNMPVEGVFHNIVLTSIRKSFPGQGIKVMNSLWGAGQMMFNKIMIVVGENVDIKDYLAVAKVVSEHVDPLKDIHFSKGPVDILDHSSSRFAFGSKLGIDATEYSPDQPDQKIREVKKPQTDYYAILSDFPEITAVNDRLTGDGISCLIISMHKSRENHIRDLFSILLNRGCFSGIKFIVVMDQQVDIFHPPLVAWICANNIDPVRDCFYVQDPEKHLFPTLIIDGTGKTEKFDHFFRDWPNIIVMDDGTIRKIDSCWNSYRIGPSLPSPSLRYKSLVFNEGAIVNQSDGSE